MSNKQTMIKSILNRFKETFTYRVFPKGHSRRMRQPLDIEAMFASLESELLTLEQETRRKTLNEVIALLKEKPGEEGWSRAFNERLVKKLEELRSLQGKDKDGK